MARWDAMFTAGLRAQFADRPRRRAARWWRAARA